MTAFYIYFIFFSGITLISASLVIFLEQIVHSVLWLILTFFGASGLFLLMGIEYFAMLFLVVYVGAVVVLFLFSIMMISKKESKNFLVSPLKYPFIIMMMSFVFLISVSFTLGEQMSFFGSKFEHIKGLVINTIPGKTHTELVGTVLYQEYYFLFLVAGLILLVAMIGSIILTIEYEKKQNTRFQHVNQQLSRSAKFGIHSIKKK